MGYGQYSGGGNGTYHSDDAQDRATGKRVAKTFTTDMVAHVWAQRTQTFGRSGNGNFYFHGDAIFSYDAHFVAGYLLDIGEAEPVAFINSNTYSPTTGQHSGTVRGAVRHLSHYEVPNLTAIGDALDVLAKYPGKPGSFVRAAKDSNNYQEIRALRLIREWLGGFEITESAEVTSRDGSYSWTREGNAEGARIIASAAGISPGELAKIQRQRVAKVAAAKVASAKHETESALRDAKGLAAMSESDFRAKWPQDGDRQWGAGGGSKPWELQQALTLATRLFKAGKAAKAKGWTRVAADVRAKEKALRSHIAGRNARIYANWRSAQARRLVEWRKNPGKLQWKGAAGTSINVGGYSERTQRIIQRAESVRYHAENAEAARTWLASREGERPALHTLEEGSPEYLAIDAAEKAERAEWETAYLAWLAAGAESESIPDKPDSVSLHSYELTGAALENQYKPDAQATYEAAQPLPFAYYRYSQARAELERRKRERDAAEREAKAAAMRGDWLAGEHNGWRGDDGNGGAVARIRDGQLETSHGASVPLEHAVKVFRFLKLCRDKGTPWHRNGQTIRVGHFQVDSIDSAGNFKAGCHNFNWPEIARIAELAGVATAEPSSEAVQVKESA